MTCVFCQIRDGLIPGEVVYQDDQVFAIRDINPHAPVHILIIPQSHILSVGDLTLDQMRIVPHLLEVARILANREGIQTSGYRLIFNYGPDSGHGVDHLHLHLLGGKSMGSLA